MKNRRKLIVMLGVVVIPADSVFRKQPFTREHAICLIFLPPLAHSDPLSVAITRLGALNGVKRDETSCTHLALLQIDFESHLRVIPSLRNRGTGFTTQRWQSRRLAFFQGPLSASISNPRSRPGRDARRYRLERLIVDPDETFDSTRCDH